MADLLYVYLCCPTVTVETWTIDEVPTETNVARIIANVQEILDEYYTPAGAPSLPTDMVGYAQINAIEKNLYMIKVLVDAMIASFKKCDTFTCGSTSFLPKARS